MSKLPHSRSRLYYILPPYIWIPGAPVGTPRTGIPAHWTRSHILPLRQYPSKPQPAIWTIHLVVLNATPNPLAWLPQHSMRFPRKLMRATSQQLLIPPISGQNDSAIPIPMDGKSIILRTRSLVNIPQFRLLQLLRPEVQHSRLRSTLCRLQCHKGLLPMQKYRRSGYWNVCVSNI